jgi:hypothetical protein
MTEKPFIGTIEQVVNAAWQAFVANDGLERLKTEIESVQGKMDPLEGAWKLGFMCAVRASETGGFKPVGKG